MGDEKRMFNRFPVLKDLAIPVNIGFNNDYETIDSAVIIDISESGIGLITFMPMEINSYINLHIECNSIKSENLKGIVRWDFQQDQVYRIGIEFTRVTPVFKKQIYAIVNDYIDCEIKKIFNAKDVCYPECRYFGFCEKSTKKVLIAM